MKNNDFCNNCGKNGHSYHQCKMPITSFGLIVYRNNPKSNKLEILMIRRKDSLGFVEFMRGKYPIMNREYILNILNEMTINERESLVSLDFDELWSSLWSGNIGFQYRSEEKTSRDKYELLKTGINNNGKNSYTLDDLLNETTTKWCETEWGFPKGRRNYQEKDINCALREFEEETGYQKNKVSIIQNILPFDELFTGSNYKCYKHRYYVGYMNYADTEPKAIFQKNEVSKSEWFSLDECIKRIRPYNKERIEIVKSIQEIFNNYMILNVQD